MRKFVLTLIAAASLVALPAYADRGYGHGYGGHGYRGGGGSLLAGVAVVGVLTGLAIMAQRPAYSGPYYTEPAYVMPPTYNAPPAGNVWYYCRSSAIYYPYTRACPEGWEPVPARSY